MTHAVNLSRIRISAIAFALASVSQGVSAISILDQITLAPENSWSQLNLNHFSDVWVDADDRPMQNLTNAKPSKIIDAWSSFAWDSNRSSMLLFGGGHANYNGNEVYRFDGATMMWERASMPSEVNKVNYLGKNYYLPVDGAMRAPQSAHTYDNTVFLKNADRMLTFGGAEADGGGAFKIRDPNGGVRNTGPYMFDPNRADGTKVGGTTGSNVQRVHGPLEGGEMWSNRDSSFATGRSFINQTTSVVSTDSEDVVYVTVRDGGTLSQLYRYTVVDANDPSSDTWEKVGTGWTGYSDQGAGAFDPDRQLYVRTGNLQNQNFYYWDLSSTAQDDRDHAAVFDAPADFSMSRNFGFDYDPVRDQFLMWEGGGNVWALDVPDNLNDPWVVSKAYSDGGNDPTGSFLTGVLGKWHYAEDLDAFIALEDSVEGNVWAYKPLAWSSPVPAIPEPETYSMMIAGLALLGMVARRRLTNHH